MTHLKFTDCEMNFKMELTLSYLSYAEKNDFYRSLICYDKLIDRNLPLSLIGGVSFKEPNQIKSIVLVNKQRHR